MTSFSLQLSSLSRCFPTPSVPFLGLRPPPAPPPHPPSPPTPPEPPDPPDTQICASSGKAHAQSLIFQHLIGLQQVHRESKPPSSSPTRACFPCRKFFPLPIAALASRRSSSRRCWLTHNSSKVKLGFHYLGQIWVHSLLGQKGRNCLLGQKWRVFLLGLKFSTSNPLDRALSFLASLHICRLKPSHHIKPHLSFHFIFSKFACSFSVVVTVLPISLPQVRFCYLLSDAYNMGSYRMVFESVILVFWNSGIVLTPLLVFDSFGSIFVLFDGTLIAVVRTFTAVCRFYFQLALLEVFLWQLGKRHLLSLTVPVILVHRGFHSPHLSFKELIILPNTSLVFSGIVIGSIVVMFVLLGAEARTIVQDGSRSAIADGLTLEALFPPSCGFDKDYRVEEVCFIDWACSVAALVELLSSPLSLALYLSFVVWFSFLSYSITLLVVVFDVLAICCLVVYSFNGG